MARPQCGEETADAYLYDHHWEVAHTVAATCRFYENIYEEYYYLMLAIGAARQRTYNETAPHIYLTVCLTRQGVYGRVLCCCCGYLIAKYHQALAEV